MKKHYPFPSIEQFRDVAYAIKLHSTYTGKDEKGEPIYDPSISKPTVRFEGTVKLHGSNCSICLLKNGELQYQSRETILDIHNDNSGFCNYMTPHADVLKDFLKTALVSIDPNDPTKDIVRDFKEYIAIYGEWCGKGIQKGTAIQQLEKMFVIFGCKIDDEWVDFDYALKMMGDKPEPRIYNILQFPTYAIDIDFNNPASVLDRLNDLALEIEAECPVAKALGVSGIGEGIVWTGSITRPTYVSPEPITVYYRFKIKGEKHKLKAKSEKAVTLDVDMYNSVKEFVEDNLSENRLNQGLSWLKENNHPIHISSMGPYIKWCVGDVKKECQLEIEANMIDEKMLNKEAGKVARDFYLNYVNTNF